jgi:diguanylate cyclase (GGDEF)-like protein
MVVDAIMHDFAGWIRKLQPNRNINRNVILKYVPRINAAPEKATDELLNIIFTNYLKAKDEFIGIINLLDMEKKELSQGEIALTSALSQQLAFSLKNILLLETLNFLARKDELTQLFNRRYFNERFTDEFLRNKRYGSFFSCVLCDLDHFKMVNDTWGHQQGDEVLRVFGQIIRDGIRRIDIAARYGGEEFILLLPETDAAGAHLVAERIRLDIGGRKFGFPGAVTASFGISCSREVGIENKQEMISRADVALYQAKRQGRNRTVIHDTAAAEVPSDPD